MATTADIKNGLCIKHNEKLFQIIEFQHVKPGKGPAFVRTKMRQIESGKVKMVSGFYDTTNGLVLFED
jgi:elongation factor P